MGIEPRILRERPYELRLNVTGRRERDPEVTTVVLNATLGPDTLVALPLPKGITHSEGDVFLSHGTENETTDREYTGRQSLATRIRWSIREIEEGAPSAGGNTRWTGEEGEDWEYTWTVTDTNHPHNQATATPP